MSDYALFIWGSYGASLGALLATAIWSLRAYCKAKARLAALGGRIV